MCACGTAHEAQYRWSPAFCARLSAGCCANGNPLHERLKVSYSEFVEKAGVCRGVIRKSLDEALRGDLLNASKLAKPRCGTPRVKALTISFAGQPA